MKIYTRGGDKGKTSLFSGERVSKASPLVEAYGTVDELNSVLGVARALHEHNDKLAAIMHQLQCELFECSATLAAGKPDDPRVSDDDVANMEQWIDELTAEMPPLTNFILPAGHPVSAALHHARTVSRRAERLAVSAFESEEGRFDAVALRYLNRLADLLFVLARVANANGTKDVLWVPGQFSSEKQS